MKLKVYWAALLGGVFATSVFFNAKKYRDRSWFWIAGKAALDCSVLALLASVLSPLLVAYCSLFVLEKLAKWIKEDRVWKTAAGVLVGIGMSALAGWFLEVILVVGVGAVDIVTGRFLQLRKQELARA